MHHTFKILLLSSTTVQNTSWLPNKTQTSGSQFQTTKKSTANATKPKISMYLNIIYISLDYSQQSSRSDSGVICFQNSSELLQHKLTLYIPWTRHPPHSCVPSCPALQAQCSWVCHTMSCPKHKSSLKDYEPSGDTPQDWCRKMRSDVSLKVMYINNIRPKSCS